VKRFRACGLYLDMNNIENDARRAYLILRDGGLVLLPTDVGYGLVAIEEPAVRRIYELKGRPASKPCVTVANAEVLARVAHPLRDDVREWLVDVTRLTPLAVIARAAESPLLAGQSDYVRGQSTHNGTIALFFRAGRIIERVAELALAEGKLVLGSSANLSGTGNNYSYENVPETMRSAADLGFDRGPAWFRNDAQLAATILDVTAGSFVRRGINFVQIEEAWNRTR
jgi:tRNA A37 threonylcarbamoyladenosine synthetase subunit TsaC/SUA5/YrdC